MDFRTFVQIIVARWKIVVAATLACVIGAIAFTHSQPKTYSASATVLMSYSNVATLSDAYAAAQTTQMRMPAYAAIANGHIVAQQAIDQLGLAIPADDLVSRTKVEYPLEATSFKLTVVDSDGERAAALAGAMADQFSAVLPKVEAGNAGPNATAVATVVERPVVPSGPVSPVPMRNLALGLLAGVLLGVVLARIRAATDRTVRERETLEKIAGLPVLAEVPRGKASNVHKKGESTWQFGSGNGLLDEELRSLRTRLLSLAGPSARSVLITGPAGGEGSTVTAVNLARSFSECGEKVLLIEGDHREPAIAKLVGVESQTDRVRTTSDHNLSVVPANAAGPDDPHLRKPALPEIMEEHSLEFEQVIVDGPPALVSADAGVLSSVCQSTVLVVRAGHTTVDEVEGALDNLRSAGGNVIGTVLIAAPLSRHVRAASRAYMAKVGEA